MAPLINPLAPGCPPPKWNDQEPHLTITEDNDKKEHKQYMIFFMEFYPLHKNAGEIYKSKIFYATFLFSILKFI